MLICGGLLDMCAGHFSVDKPPNIWRCKNCVYFSRKFYETTGLPYSTYNEYIIENEKKLLEEKIQKLSF